MDNKMKGLLYGGILILIAIILFAVQHFGVYNLYGDVSNKWYFYGLVGIIGLIGVILALWLYTKK